MDKLEIQQILDRKIYSGKVLYLVKWKSDPIEKSTWQSIKVLQSSKPLINQFLKKRNIDPKSHEENLDVNEDIIKVKLEEMPKRKRGRPSKKDAQLRSLQQRNHINQLNIKAQMASSTAEEQSKNENTYQQIKIEEGVQINFNDSRSQKSKQLFFDDGSSIDKNSQSGFAKIDEAYELGEDISFMPHKKMEIESETRSQTQMKQQKQQVKLSPSIKKPISSIAFSNASQKQINYFALFNDKSYEIVGSHQLRANYPHQFFNYLEEQLKIKQGIKKM